MNAGVNNGTDGGITGFKDDLRGKTEPLNKHELGFNDDAHTEDVRGGFLIGKVIDVAFGLDVDKVLSGNKGGVKVLGKGADVFGDNIILSKWFNIAWLWPDNVEGTDVDAGIVTDTGDDVDIDCNVKYSVDVCVETSPGVNPEAVIEITPDFDSGTDVETSPGVNLEAVVETVSDFISGTDVENAPEAVFLDEEDEL